MVLNVFSIYDIKAEIFGRPIYAVSPGVAMRTFTDEAQNEESVISKHPEDYVLFHLGSFEDSTAKHTELKSPYKLGSAKDLIGSGRKSRVGPKLRKVS